MQADETTRTQKWIICGALLTLATLLLPSAAQPKDESLSIRKVTVSDGVELHYVERGTGVPVVFIHGSLSDGGFWNDQVGAFAASGYRAVAYSRRYNPPNTNKARPGYSASVDADDLAALIGKLHLERVHLVGHSYGALAALFLAVKHPELVRTLVLAEAPAVSLLAHLSSDRSEVGKETFADIQQRMVKPMEAAFQKGDKEAGLRAFMAYVFDDPQAWDKMSEAARQDTLNHAHEWDIMMTTGSLFPELDPEAVRRITAPALLLSGENSYSFLKLIDQELERLLPHGRRIILRGATHRMWFEQPEVCRKTVLDFWRAQERGARLISGPQVGSAGPAGIPEGAMEGSSTGHAEHAKDVGRLSLSADIRVSFIPVHLRFSAPNVGL
jgi:pimeloyl-ACP methyl ester carboxylesterase